MKYSNLTVTVGAFKLGYLSHSCIVIFLFLKKIHLIPISNHLFTNNSLILFIISKVDIAMHTEEQVQKYYSLKEIKTNWLLLKVI